VPWLAGGVKTILRPRQIYFALFCLLRHAGAQAWRTVITKLTSAPTLPKTGSSKQDYKV